MSFDIVSYKYVGIAPCVIIRTPVQASANGKRSAFALTLRYIRFGLPAGTVRACKRIKVPIVHPIFGADLNVLPAKKPRYSSGFSSSERSNLGAQSVPLFFYRPLVHP